MKSFSEENVEEPMLVSVGISAVNGGTGMDEDDVDGHCQKHCPLTVHQRYEGGTAADCAEDTVPE